MSNKIAHFLLLLFAIMMSACWGQRKTIEPTLPVSPTPKVKTYEPATTTNNTSETAKPPTTTPPPTQTPTTTTTTTTTTTNSTTTTNTAPNNVKPPHSVPPSAGRNANIAVLLPLGSQLYTPTLSIDALPDKLQNGLEFYEGLLVAVDYLKSQGFTPQIQVYDTQNDPKQVEQILAKPELKMADCIIGPMYNAELKAVANFAKQQRIYHFSPVSPSNQVASDNPYYVVVNPSVETHCAAIYAFAKQHPPCKIIAVASNKPNEIALSQQFRSFANSPEGYAIPSVTTLLTTDNIETKLSPNERNIIVMTTFAELPAIEWVNKLYSLRKKYDITLFGMPNWLEMENIDLTYLAALDFHYTTEFWVNENASEHQAFKQAFAEKFGNKPTKFSAKGYDLMRYVGDMWRAYSGDIANAITLQSRGIYTDFNFGRHVQGENNAYMENQYVHIIRYRPDFVLEKER